MSKRASKIIRRFIAVFVAIIIAVSIALSYSSDRSLKATALPEEDRSEMSAYTLAEDEVSEESYNIQLPQENAGEVQLEAVPVEEPPAPEPAAPVIQEAPPVIPPAQEEVLPQEPEPPVVINPVEEAPAVQEPAEEAPAVQNQEEEVPAEEVPAEEAPAEEVPAESPADQESQQQEQQTFYTVTFTSASEIIEIQEVPENTGIVTWPQAPLQEGYRFTGWYQADGTLADETFLVTEDVTLFAEYVREWTVTWKSGEDSVIQVKADDEELLSSVMPQDPVKEGTVFMGWYEEDGRQVSGDLSVTQDLTLQAKFGYVVDFSVQKGQETEPVMTRIVEENASLEVLPATPFWAGHKFTGWQNPADGTPVTEQTPVTGNLQVLGTFDDIQIYTVSVDYYYIQNGTSFSIDKTVLTVDAGSITEESPLTISSPPQYELKEDGSVQAGVIYYPETQTIMVTPQDLLQADENHNLSYQVEYRTEAVEYSIVYLLETPDGTGYEEMERSEGLKAVMGSLVTPEIRNYPFADFEKTSPYQIAEDQQELPVYYTRKDFSLVFDTQGGTSVEPVVAPYETSVDLTGRIPEKTGYTFEGWYMDEEYKQMAGQSITLEENTVLYAKWKGKTVNYAIVYMKEKYDNVTGTTSYVYDNSRTASGVVGSKASADQAPKLTNNINGYEYDAARNADSEITIAADGSSVLTVYYSLIRYTLVFNANGGTVNMGGRTYTGSEYQIPNVVLGQDISAYWPSSSNEIYHKSKYFSYWTGASEGNYVTRRYELIYSNVSKANANRVMTFTATWSSSSYNRNAQYWLQQPDGTYVEETDYTQIGLNTNNLGAKDIDGYTKHGSNASAPAGYQGSGVETTVQQVWVEAATDTISYTSYQGDSVEYYGTTYTYSHSEKKYGMFGGKTTYYYYTAVIPGHYEEQEVTGVYTYRFYYDRDSFSISYFDGSSQVAAKEHILFGVDITGWEYNFVPDRPEGKEDYAWGGWYLDAGLTTKYNFTVMPGNNLALYAKWIPPQYTLTFHRNDGGSEDLLASYTLDLNTLSADPGNPVRAYYRFLGWFTAPDGGRQYLPGSELVVQDLDLYAHWEILPLKYTVRYTEKATGKELFPAKTVENPAFVPGQQITEEAAVIAGYLPYDSTATVTLDYDAQNNQILFEYGPKTTQLTYTVRYVLYEDPTVAVAEEKTLTVEGTYASVTETAADVTNEDYMGYRPMENTKTLQLGLNSETNLITFYYVPDGAMVTVSVFDMAGNLIPGFSQEPVFYHIGEVVEVPVDFQGYTLHHMTSGQDGAAQGHTEFLVNSNDDMSVNVYLQKNLTITARSRSVVYNGTALANTGVSDAMAVGLAAGHTLQSVSFTGSRTNAGSSSSLPGNAVISGAPDQYYNIHYHPGTLNVTKAPVVINVEPDRWNDGNPYDGTERTIGFRNLRNNPQGTDGVSINNSLYESLYGQMIRDMVRNLTLTGTDAGFYRLPAATIREAVSLPADSNFQVVLNVRDGELTIPKASLTITTESAEKEYDGTPLTESGISADGLVEGEEISLTANGTITDAGSTVNTYILDWGEVNPDNYEITENLGVLTVTPSETQITIRISGNQLETLYNGEEQSVFGYTVEAEDPSIQITAAEDAQFTAAGTDAGVYPMELSADMFTAWSENYTNIQLEVTNGELRILPAPGSPELIFHGKSYLYDKTPHHLEEASAGTAGGNTRIEYSADGETWTEDLSSITAVHVSDSIDVQARAYNDNYEEAAQASASLKILPVPLTVSTGSASKAYDGKSLTESTVTVAGLVDTDQVTAAATGTITEKGSVENTCTISWDEAFEEDYTLTQNLGTLTVTDPEADVVLTAASVSRVYDGTPLSDSTVTATGLPEGFTVEAAAAGSQTDAGVSSNVVQEGYVIRDARNEDKTHNFNVVTVDGTLTVNPKELLISTGSAGKAYDGTALQSDVVSTEGLITGENVIVTATGSQTETGESDNTYQIQWESAKAGNYHITEDLGTLTVTANPDPVILTAASAQKVYDGIALSAPEVTATGLPAGFVAEAAASGSQTDMGQSENTVDSGYVIKDASGNDKTANFTNISTVSGTLQVTPKELTITTGSASQAYDGTALSSDEILIGGLISGEEIQAHTSGSITEPGSALNTYEITWGDVRSSNYTITENLGTLTVSPNGTQITLTAASSLKIYDGTPLQNPEVSVSGLPEGFSIEAAASGSQTDAGSAVNSVNPDYSIKDPSGEDKTEHFTNIVLVDGELKVDPAPLTISTGSAGKPYDGQPLTCQEYTIEGLQGTDVISLEITGTQTQTGASDNTFTIDWQNVREENYAVTLLPGTLTVTENTVEIVLTAPSASKTYDGTALTAEGSEDNPVKAQDLPEGFTLEATASGSQTDAGSSTNVVDENYVIKDVEGNDRTSSFTNILTVDGTLTVQPKAMTISTGSASKAYDGKALTSEEVSIEGLIEGESVTAAAIGTITEVGTAQNLYEITWDNARTENYTVTELPGLLTVTVNSSEILLTAPSAEKTYDGSALEAPGTAENPVIATGLPEGFTVEASASGSQTGAGSSANKVDEGYLIKDGDEIDRTGWFTGITTADGTLTVHPKEITITTGSAEKAYDGQPLVNEEVSAEGLAEGESITLTAVGSISTVGSADNTYEILWDNAQADNYILTENLGTLTITENADQVILTAPSAEKTYDGSALTAAGTGDHPVTVTGLPEGFTLEASATGSQKDAGISANVVDDNYVIRDPEGNDRTGCFTNVVKEDGTLTVNPGTLTITTESGTKAYDGAALTASQVTVEGLAEGESVTAAATGSITEVGEKKNTYEITWDNALADNYVLTENLGVLSVTENDAEVLLTAPSAEKIYDGTELTAPGDENLPVTWTGLPAGFTVEAAASGSQTDAGSSANVVDVGYVIRDAAGNDRTSSFTNVITQDGILTVHPKELMITTGSALKAYDGKELKNDEYSIEGLVENESVTLIPNGTLTEVGETDNTYEITWDNARAENYTITDLPGTLTITPNNSEIILTAPSAGKTYDGTALEAPGDETNPVTAAGLPEGFTVEAAASGSQTDAGTAANIVEEGYVIRDAAGNDRTSCFTNITTAEGILTVNPKPVTITTGSAGKAYDGSALTNDAAAIEGLAEGESVTLLTTGTLTEIGETENTYEITWDNARAENYVITENLGMLTVLASDAGVVLTAPSAGKTYDGTALEAPGTEENPVTWSGLPEGFTVEASASGSQTDAGSSANVVDDGYVIRDPEGNDRTSNFTNVTKLDGTLTVNPKALVITTGSANKAYDGTALTSEEAAVEGLVDGETVTLSAAGTITEVGTADNTYQIAWDTAKAENYTVTENIGQLAVTDNHSEILLTAPSAEKIYDGTALEAPGTDEAPVTASGLPEGFTLTAAASGSQTAAGSSANVVEDGYTIRNSAGEDRTSCFTNIKKVDGTLTVTPRPLTVSTGSASKVFDGEPLANDEVSAEGLAEGESVTLTATGSLLEVGTADNTYEIIWDHGSADNYTITDNPGTLTVLVNAAEVVLTAPSASKTYDGTALEAESPVTWTNLPAGFTVEATASGSQTDAGASSNLVDEGYVIRDAEGNDRTAFFTNITTAEGTLTVNPRPLTITTGSANMAYDGQTLGSAEVSVEGLVEGESVTLTATGTVTDVGSAENTYEIIWDNAKKDNYVITENLGTLTVLESDAGVVLTAPSAGKTYDGTALSAAGSADNPVTWTGLPEGFTVEATASGSQTDAGSSANVVDDGYVIRDAAGNDRTASFTNVTKADGTLTVNPRPLTIATGSANKPYDGQPLTNQEVTIEGLAEQETVSLTATGSLTEVGTADNTYEIAWENAKEENYRVTENLGVLTVTTNSSEIVLTAPSAGKVYDGTALEAAGGEDNPVTAAGLPAGFTIEASAGGSQTDAGSSANVINEGYVIRDASGNDRTSCFTNIVLAEGTLTVEQRPLTISTGSAEKAFDNTPLTNPEVTVEGLAEGESISVTADGTLTETGETENTFTVAWDQAKAENYIVTENPGTLTITANDSEVVLKAPSAEKIYDGTPLTAAGTSDNPVTATGLPAGFTISASASGSQTNAGSSANLVNEDYKILDADGNDRTALFTNVRLEEGLLRIVPRQITLISPTITGEYDGSAVADTQIQITGDGFAEGEGADYQVTGTRTIPGSSENTFTYTLWEGTNADNYVITLEPGTLTVTSRELKYEITVESAGGSALYDGEVHQVEGLVQDTYQLNGHTYTIEGVSASAEGTHAGEYSAALTGTPVIRDENGNDVTGEFLIHLQEGTLSIQKRRIHFASASASAQYSGDALTDDTITVTGDGFAEGEGADLEVTGSQVLPGFSPNTFTYTLKDQTLEEDYIITTETGTLTVTGRDARFEIEMQAAGGTFLYDGTEHTVSGFETSRFGIGNHVYTVEGIQAQASGTHAGTYKVSVSGTPVVRDENGNDVTDQFAVTVLEGTLEILPRTVILTSGSVEKPYDGTALSEETVTVSGDGFAEGEGVEFIFPEGRTLTGITENTFRYQLTEDTDPSDYQITIVYGSLNVTSRTEDARFEITVYGAKDHYVYDGTEHSTGGIRMEEDTPVRENTEEAEDVELYASEGQNFEINGVQYVLQGLSSSLTRSDAGTYPVPVTGTPVILDSSGNDVSDQFVVHTSPGELCIDRRKVTLESGSAEQIYNGRELVNETITVTGDGFAEGEGASYEFSGGRTLEGVSENTFTYTLNDITSPDNYEIDVKYGSLTILDRDAKYLVTVTARSGEYLYDGTEKTLEGFLGLQFTFDEVVYTISGLSARASAVDAGEYEVTVSGVPQVMDPEGNDVSSQFAVKTVNGTLTIRPRYVLLQSVNAKKSYDGTPLSTKNAENQGIVIGADGFAEGEGAVFSGFTSRTKEGTSDNIFSWTLAENTKPENYVIETQYGTLEVTEEQTVPAEPVIDTPEPGPWPDPDVHQVVITYVDEEGEEVAPPHTGRYETGETFGPVLVPQSPEGTADYDMITAPAEGVPDRDVNLQVVYHKDVPKPQTDQIRTAELVYDETEDDFELVEISDQDVPLAAMPAGYWALLNLLLALCCIFFMVLMIVILILNRKEEEEEKEETEKPETDEEEEQKKKRRKFLLIPSVILAIASAVIFLLTEDMRRSIRWTDNWTILMLVLALLSLVVFIVYCKKKKGNEEEEEA